MTAGRRESAVRMTGTLLDRAVHDAVVRLWPLAIPFVLIDLEGLMFGSPFSHVFLISVAYSALLENRSHAIAVRSLVQHDGRRLAWRAAFGYPRSLWFALAGLLDTLPLLLLGVLIAIPLGLARPGGFPLSALALAAGGALGLALEAVVALVLVAVMLLIVAATAAAMDVVADGSPPLRALRRWLGWTFRRRTLGSTLLVSIVYIALYIGVTMALAALPIRPPWLQAVVCGVLDGIADTIAFVFLWHWRGAVLDREVGRDLFAALEPLPPAVADPVR